MENIKALLAFIGGIVASFFGKYGVIIALVLFAVVFDFATGLIKAKILGNASSKIGYKGIWKKVSLLFALLFGIFLDFVLPYILSAGVGVALPFPLPIGLIMGVYIIVNEAISICENFYQSGFKMPNWIIKFLKVANEELDGK